MPFPWPIDIPTDPLGARRFPRAEARDLLLGTLARHGTCVVTPGQPGSGVRTLLAEIARDVLDRYPGGIFWLEASLSHPREMASDVSMRLSREYLNWPFQNAQGSMKALWRQLGAAPKSLLVVVGASPDDAVFFGEKPSTVDLLAAWTPKVDSGLGLTIPELTAREIRTALELHPSASATLGTRLDDAAERLRGDALGTDLLLGLSDLDAGFLASRLDGMGQLAFDRGEPLVSLAIDTLDASALARLSVFAALAPRPIRLDWLEVFLEEGTSGGEAGSSPKLSAEQLVDALLARRLVSRTALGEVVMHERVRRRVAARDRKSELAWTGAILRGIRTLGESLSENALPLRAMEPHFRQLWGKKDLVVPPDLVGDMLSLHARICAQRGFDPVPAAEAALETYRRAEADASGPLTYRAALSLAHWKARGDPLGARAPAEEALAIAERHFGPTSGEVVAALQTLARVARGGACGSPTDEELAFTDRAVQILEQLPDIPRAVLAEKVAWASFGHVSAGHGDRGLDGLRRAVAMVEGEGSEVENQILDLLTTALVETRHFDEALEVGHRATRVARQTMARRNFVGNGLAPLVITDLGKDGALRLLTILDEVLAWTEWEGDLAAGSGGTSQNDPTSGAFGGRKARRSFARIQSFRAVVLLGLGRTEEAREEAERALPVIEEELGRENPRAIRLRRILDGSLTAETVRMWPMPPK